MWKQGWNLNKSRKISSSGGIAYALMKSFIDSGGYVAACLFENGKFAFDVTNDGERIVKFVGSKYVKSDPTDVFERVKELVNNNKVLFIALPCQVAAMKQYIGKDKNLITIDLICHGSPDPQMLDCYLKEVGLRINQINDIQFRKKSSYGLIVDGKRIAVDNTIDDYTYSFIKGLGNTLNCYSCQFATIKRCSDITLGDSWGTEYKNEEKKGISLILVQTEIGRKLLEKADIELRDVDLNNSINNNKQLMRPSVKPRERELFLQLIEKNNGFRKSLLRVAPKATMKRIVKEKMIKTIKKIKEK